MKRKKIRTCIACGEKKDKELLLKTLCDPNKGVVFSLRYGEGRGAYICPRAECMKKALKKGAFKKAFKQSSKKLDKEKDSQSLIRLALKALNTRIVELSSAKKTEVLKKKRLFAAWIKQLELDDK